MNEQFMKQTEEMMAAVKNVQVPENVQAMTEEGVARSREAYEKMAAVAREATSGIEEVAVTHSRGVRTIGEQMLDVMTANTEAAFDAAAAIAGAKTLPEAARMQADFLQQQMAKAGEQTKELYETSSRVTRETVETLNQVATKTMDHVKT